MSVITGILGIVVGIMVGIFLGEKITLKLVERNLRAQGWSKEAIKHKVFRIEGQ